MKKLLIVIIAIIAIFSITLLKFALTYVSNELIISDYNKNKYDNNLIYTLYFLNVSEPYIVYYNHGNLLYRLEKYDDAIDKYETALTKSPEKDRVCDIRINLSLSYIKTIDENDRSSALNILSKAKDILYEDDCASIEDDRGESKQAEKLEEEIKKLEAELKEGEEENGNSNNNNNNNEEEKPVEEKSVEEQLKEIQRQSHQSRQEEMEYNNALENYSYYSGQYW